MPIILTSIPTKSRTQSLFSSHNSLDVGRRFWYALEGTLPRDDLIVAWHATGGSKEVKKEGRETEGSRCRKGELHAWAPNVNGRSADEKEGKVRNFGRCPLPRHTRTHTRDFLSRSHEKSNSSSRVLSFYCLIFSDIRPSYKSFPHSPRFESFARAFLVFNKQKCEVWRAVIYIHHLEYYH